MADLNLDVGEHANTDCVRRMIGDDPEIRLDRTRADTELVQPGKQAVGSRLLHVDKRIARPIRARKGGRGDEPNVRLRESAIAAMNGARIFVGALVVGIALGGALELHNRELHRPPRDVCAGPGYSCWSTGAHRPSWVDPLALFIAVVGVGAGAAILVSARATIR
jgi:hypothetical protein